MPATVRALAHVHLLLAHLIPHHVRVLEVGIRYSVLTAGLLLLLGRHVAVDSVGAI
jgi:hypothetical protein